MTQRDRIMRHLREVGSLTGAQAMSEYGIAHLASRITELVQAGQPIKKRMASAKNRYGETVSFCVYSLEMEETKCLT